MYGPGHRLFRRSWQYFHNLAGGARGAGGLAACLGPLAYPRDVNLHMAVGGGVAQRREQLLDALAKAPVVLRADQHIDPADAALRVEQLEEVRLAIHDADDPSLAWEFGCRLGHVVQAVEPAPGLAGRVVGLWLGVRGTGGLLVALPRVVLGGHLVGRRLIEPATQHPQGQTCPTHRKRQMQAQGLRRGLVAPDDAQSLAARSGREVQVRPILDAQHRIVPAHALDGARSMRRDDVLGRDLRLIRVVYQAVVALHRRAVRGADERMARTRCEQCGASHQPCRQALVSQRGASKLVCRPLCTVQAFAGAARRCRVGLCHAQGAPPVRSELVHVDRLHRAGAVMGAVVASSTRGGADAHEVRRLETDSVVLGVDEGLHQPRTVVVARLEVCPHPAQHPPQQMAGQMAAAHRGADEESAQAHHPVQMGGALRIAPPHPRIARAKTQRRGRESDRAQPSMGRPDEIAELATDEGGGAVRMLVGEQCVPYPALCLVLDHHQPQPFDIAHRTRHADGRGHRCLQAARRGSMAVGTRRRQSNLSLGLQHRERLQAPCELRGPAGIDESELRADFTPQSGTALERTVCHNGLEACLGLGRTKRLENLALEPHAVDYT